MAHSLSTGASVDPAPAGVKDGTSASAPLRTRDDRNAAPPTPINSRSPQMNHVSNASRAFGSASARRANRVPLWKISASEPSRPPPDWPPNLKCKVTPSQDRTRHHTRPPAGHPDRASPSLHGLFETGIAPCCPPNRAAGGELCGWDTGQSGGARPRTWQALSLPAPTPCDALGSEFMNDRPRFMPSTASPGTPCARWAQTSSVVV